jgi:hypothetical protein
MLFVIANGPGKMSLDELAGRKVPEPPVSA